MSYEIFKKDVETVAPILDYSILEDLDHALSTDEQLLDKVIAVQNNLRQVADSLKEAIKQYQARINQKP